MQTCPSESLLTVWAQTGEVLSDSVLEHLDTCRACRRIIATVANSISLSAISENEEELSPILELRRGASLGRYLVLELLGVGGMGAVWSAYDSQLDRRVALKQVRTFLSESHEAKQALLVEAQTMAKLKHPNVRSIYDALLDGEQAFLVMELVEGQSLSQWLTSPRTWKEVVHVFLEAGKGLVAAHRAAVIHRDFKPDNILIAEDGRVQVTDFGLAHSVSEVSSSPAGTVVFMAPELRRGESSNALSDQYSYCTAFELALPVNAPQWVRQLVEVGLEKEPHRRHPDLETLLLALEKRLVPRRSALTLGAMVASLALVLGIGAWLYQQSQVCAVDQTAWADIWNLERQQQLESAFLSTQKRYAPHTWQTIRSELEEYTRRWVIAKKEACEATRVRQEQSEAALDSRMACLAARQAQVAALVEVFAHADATVLENATTAVAGLSRQGLCEYATADSPPPDSAEFRQAQAGVARVSALRQSGKIGEGLQAAEQVQEAVQRVNDLPLRANALYEHGALLMARGKKEEAKKLLFDAIWAADRARTPELRARAWLELMEEFSKSGQKAECINAGQSASAALESMEVIPARWASWVAVAFGNAWRQFGEPLRAIEYYRQAIQLAGTNLDFAASAELGLATALKATGKLSEADDMARTGLKRIQIAKGQGHPNVAAGQSMLANILKAEQKLEESLQLYQEALATYTEVYGPQHLNVAAAHASLAGQYQGMGRFDDAIEQYKQSVGIFQSLGEDSHPNLATTYNNLGLLLTILERPQEALRYLQEGIRINEKKSLGNVRMARLHDNLSNVYIQLKQPQKAVSEAKLALSLFPKAPVDPDAVLILADALRSASQIDAANKEYLRVEKLILGKEYTQYLRAAAQFGRAIGLASSQPSKAKAMAIEARAVLKQDPTEVLRVKEIDAFLSKRALPKS